MKMNRPCPLVLLKWFVLFLLAQGAQAATWYVATNGNDAAAGTNWATAKRTIQAAVDGTVAGDTVVVSNGIYASGVTVSPGYTTSNRVVITKNITVQSVNGPGATSIRGLNGRVVSNYSLAANVRCVFITNGVLSGFTLTNGATPSAGTLVAPNISGGGAYAPGGILSNCIIAGCASDNFGGGSFDGTLYDCVLSGNRADNQGGGAYTGTLNRCTLSGNWSYSGGGAMSSTLNNCLISGNTAELVGGGVSRCAVNYSILSANRAKSSGGGADVSALKGCLLLGNSADGSNGRGGGSFQCSMVNCTVFGNSAAVECGGAYSGGAQNCIVYSNAAPTNANFRFTTFSNSCTVPMPVGGTGNITGDPQFVSVAATNLHLLAISPCINAGANAFVTNLPVDLDGNPRVVGGTVDMGAYESPPRATVAVITNPASGGVVAGGGIYFTGTNTTLQATPNPLWTFVNWNDGVTDATRIITVPASNITYTANFAAPLPIVSVATNPVQGGTVGGGGAYPAGSNVVLTATPNTYWNFVNWNDGVTDAIRTITVPATNISFTANFTQQVVTLSIVTNPANSGTVSGGGTYQIGTPVLLVATAAAPHWFFTGWNDGEMNPTRTVIVPATNITYTAGFTQIVGALTLHVATNGADWASGLSWTAAKQTIQAAIDVAMDGDTVLVSNGVYATGTRRTPGYQASNRVVITQNITVQSVNGPLVTSIQGLNGVAQTNFSTADNVRCVFMTNGILSGFTLANGGTPQSIDPNYDESGAGANAKGGTLSNCTLSGNSAYNNGGGAFFGTLYNCTLSGNTARYNGGGAYNGALNNCTLAGNKSVNGDGGGVIYGTLNNCVLTGNSALGLDDVGGGSAHSTLNNCILASNAAYYGGGTIGGTLTNCTLYGNRAVRDGGGSNGGVLNNCALFGNSASNGGGSYYGTLYNCTLSGNTATNGGGAYFSTLYNSIVYFNNAAKYANHTNAAFNYSCTTPMPTNGIGNITSDPQFVNAAASNFHLMASSPCINVGNNAYATNSATDLDGNPRIVNGTVDMGAFESIASTPTATVTVTASPANAGTVVGGGTYQISSSVVISAVANVGWLFSMWHDGDTNPVRTITVPASNITFAAIFTQHIAIVSVGASPALGGSVTGNGEYQVGSNVVISATPAAYWLFSGWNDGDTNATRSISVSSAGVMYTANFVQQLASLAVHANPVAGGIVTGGGTYQVGSNVIISASANLSWRFAGWSDGGTQGVRLVSVPAAGATYTAVFRSTDLADFDGDGKSDIAAFFKSTGIWRILPSSGVVTSAFQFGSSTIIPVVADYDGDGKADAAVYHNGAWFIRWASTSVITNFSFGWSAALPVPADYDGDGRADLAVYHPAAGVWYIRQSSTATMLGGNAGIVLGNSASIPVPADYDGDGMADVAIYRPSTGMWTIRRSSTGISSTQSWGWSTALPVQGDYDGDGKADIAVYHPAVGNWYVRKSSDNVGLTMNWGWSAAAPVPADYDGDGKTDLAVYNKAGPIRWYVQRSSGGSFTSTPGGNNDVPVLPQFNINRRFFPTP